jgi:DNA-directed RNA polymerase subunit RPC12/RpoP
MMDFENFINRLDEHSSPNADIDDYEDEEEKTYCPDCGMKELIWSGSHYICGHCHQIFDDEGNEIDDEDLERDEE